MHIPDKAMVESLERRTLFSSVNVNSDPPNPVEYGGKAIGTAGSYHNLGNTIAKALDNLTTTFYDAPVASGAYVGEDLGSPKVINYITFASRPGFESRMVGGEFQASNSASFSGAVTLYTVNFAPPSNTFISVGLANTTAYRYFRYVGPAGSYCNIAELHLFSDDVAFASVDSGGILSVPCSNAADNINVYFSIDATNTGNTGYFTIDDNGIQEWIAAAGVTQLSIDTLNGPDSVNIDGSQTNDLSVGSPSELIINFNAGSGNDSIAINAGNWITSEVNAGNGNDSVLVRGGDFANVVVGNGNDSLTTEAENDPHQARLIAGNGNDTLTAQFFGDGGQQVYMSAGTGQDSFNNTDSFATVQSNYGAVAINTTTIVGTISSTQGFLPGNKETLVFLDSAGNGMLQPGEPYEYITAETAGEFDFSGLSDQSNYTVAITPPPGYKILEPVSGNSYTGNGNLLNFSFLITPNLSQLTGKVIGTAGSFKNNGNTIANAVDGNLSTYFDGPDAGGDWVGIDFGLPVEAVEVQFAPRAGYADRMIGGQIQASNTADFSSGVVQLQSIGEPATGVLTTVKLINAKAYRYYRYIGPADGWCNIAELEFQG